MFKKLEISTGSRAEFVDITDLVQGVVSESGVREGICFLFVPHTTAGITINENWDPSVRRDIITVLNEAAPPNRHYAHTEGNADAHIKTSIVGSSAFLIVSGGRLQMGTWQGIFLAEFDGPRRRRVLVRVIPDGA